MGDKNKVNALLNPGEAAIYLGTTRELTFKYTDSYALDSIY